VVKPEEKKINSSSNEGKKEIIQKGTKMFSVAKDSK